MLKELKNLHSELNKTVGEMQYGSKNNSYVAGVRYATEKLRKLIVELENNT